MATPRYLIVADGDFGPMTSKTANSVIRYHPERTVGVLDREHAGKTVQDVLGFGGAIPIVESMRAGLALKPNAILIGIAPQGGRLPDEWRAWLAEALDAVVLTVGTDCNVGKMTAQLQLARELNTAGLRTRFVPTGQTGIMIEGWGIAVDAVVSDFVAGAAERLVLQGSEDADIVLVEGQGSINHPGYSAVTLGLMHGSCPDAMILCHQTTRQYIGDYRQAAWLRLPSLSEYVRLYETIGSAVHPTKVIGISLNTYDMSEEAARRACETATRETGLSATDPVRFDPAPLLDAVQRGRQAYLARRKELVSSLTD
jgi:D-glutamate N-acetyltransferase